MHKNKNNIYLICLAILAIILQVINFIADVTLNIVNDYLKLSAGLLFILSFISVVRYAAIKTSKFYKISLISVSLLLISNVILIKDVVAYEINQYEMSKVREISSCEDAEIQFDEDLDKGKLKFFTFGLAPDENTNNKLEEKYDLHVYHMGCIVSSALECYNDLVKEHYKGLSI